MVIMPAQIGYSKVANTIRARAIAILEASRYSLPDTFAPYPPCVSSSSILSHRKIEDS